RLYTLSLHDALPIFTATRALGRTAEVRSLVPAIPAGRQRGDHVFVIALHRLGLPRELGAVGMREARARLRLQLVRRHVLRLERRSEEHTSELQSRFE